MRRVVEFADGTFHVPPVVTESLESRLQRQRAELLAAKQIYPLAAPGGGTLGGDSAFLRYAEAVSLSDPPVKDGTVEERIEKSADFLRSTMARALWREDFSLRVGVAPFQEREAQFIPGHLWQQDDVTPGPAPAKVMIINRIPSALDARMRRTLQGNEGKMLRRLMEGYNDFDLDSIYVTNLLKFVPPDGKNRLKAEWRRDCMALLRHEILLVQPEIIVALGAEVMRTFLGVSGGQVVEANLVDYAYDIAMPGMEPQLKNARVVMLTHPQQALQDASVERQIEAGVFRLAAVVSGRLVDEAGRLDHTVIDSHEQLLEALLRVENDERKTDAVIAVDAEWQGEHPVNNGSYVRSIQLAWLPGCALGIKIFEAGGEVVAGFRGDSATGLRSETIDLLCTFFLGGEYVTAGGERHYFGRKRVVGHFFNADLEWLVAYGIDIRACFECPLLDLTLDADAPPELVRLYKAEGFADGATVPAWYRTNHEGGADTGLMAHAIEESADYKLEVQAMRHTSAPRYDSALRKWKDAYCAARKIKASEMEGYGDCPDDVLMPYGMFDADVTLRLFYRFDALLNEDYDGNNCREAFWESQIAAPAVLEIHQTGLVFDRDRFDFLQRQFVVARDRLLASLRETLRWPDYNPRSLIHMKESLFGSALNGKIDPATGRAVSVRPEGAYSLALTPVFDTSKPPKPWLEVMERGDITATPSTDQKVLGVLYHSQTHPGAKAFIGTLRDFKFVNQVLTTTLRLPRVDKKTQEDVLDEEGNVIYDKGLASFVCDDGRVRTHIYQTKETGRWSSARPNLQNLSKRRDKNYKDILGENYKHKIRSVFKAAPGYVLIDADFVGAELFAMAIMSGDATMIDHATRNQLPESDPRYYDIHSNIAVMAFRLQCEPTKSALDRLGVSHLRIVAKSVIFGCAYGRGAKAIALAAEEEGIALTVEEAQAVIDAIYAMYPRLKAFFEECRARAAGEYFPPYAPEFAAKPVLVSAFGRYRRFPALRSDGSFEADRQKNRLAGEYGRQAMNFPIQSMVASVVSRAAAWFSAFKRLPGMHDDLFKITLQIHDALTFQVPYRYVQYFCEQALPYCMRTCVPIWPTTLEGKRLPAGPFFLGVEADVMDHWGEVLSYERAQTLGLPTGVYAADGCVVNYSKSKPA